MIEIESGVPMPARLSKSGITEAIRKMQIGESLIYSSNNGVHAFFKRENMRCVTRKIGPDQYRIWRIE